MVEVRKESDAKWAARDKQLCEIRDSKLAAEKTQRQYQLNYLINVTHPFAPIDLRMSIISMCNVWYAIGACASLACCC
jgi:hypothetical protein